MRACARAPLEVAVWTNEEGSRFVPVMMGSGVFAGAFTLDHALAQCDRDGVSVRDALAAIGYAGDANDGAARIRSARISKRISSRPVLEAHDTTIGVVEGALGQRALDARTPDAMALRRDALLVASDLVRKVNDIACAHPPHGRGTVGWVDVHPNSRNVIPGRVTLTVDLRAADDATLATMDAELRAACADRRSGRHANRRRAGRVLPAAAVRRDAGRAGACARARAVVDERDQRGGPRRRISRAWRRPR